MIAQRSLLSFVLATGACASSDPAPAVTDARATDTPSAADAPADVAAPADASAPVDASAPADAAVTDRAAPADVAGDAAAAGPVPGDTTVTHRIAANAGLSGVVRDGVPGCAVTAATGSSFRLVCGANDAAASIRHVEGSLWTRGAFARVTAGCADGACALEAGERVSDPIAVPGGQRVDFSWEVARDVDGVDVVVTGEPLYLSIRMDGLADPSRVYFPSQEAGGAAATAGGDPFALTTK